MGLETSGRPVAMVGDPLQWQAEVWRDPTRYFVRYRILGCGQLNWASTHGTYI